eukprot:XP_025002712.1 WD repeat-containing protein 73 isoform X3 [Gallus gallus]
MEAAGERGEEEEEEEWLLQSLHLYEALHAFELQAPTRVIEWALGKRVCVAGYGCAGRNEILQLLPPPALQAKESRGLCPERDFKVECGGFSNRPVYNLKHVPDTSSSQPTCRPPQGRALYVPGVPSHKGQLHHLTFLSDFLKDRVAVGGSVPIK